MKIYNVSLEVLNQAIKDLGEKGGWWVETHNGLNPLEELGHLYQNLISERNKQDSKEN